MTAAAIRQKVDRGVKRRCAACSTLFYDLLHYPIQCPKCGALFDVNARPKLLPSSPKRKVAGARSRSKTAAVPLAEPDEQKWPSPKTEEAPELDGQADQEDAILDRDDEDEGQGQRGEAEET